MTHWPKTYAPEAAPREVIELAGRLVPQMLAGDELALEALREQYDRGRVVSVELTGAGFFVVYEVPEDCPRAKPADFQGGGARIEVAGVERGAGCVFFVKCGRIAFLECYTFDGVWPEDAKVLAVRDVVPLVPPMELPT